MVEREQIIIIIFRLLNFGVLIGLTAYIYKKYLLPMFKEQWDKIKEMFESLRRSHRHLQRERHVVEKNIVDDRALQNSLQENVLQWQALISAKRDQLQQEREERKRILDKQMKVQREQVAQYRAYRHISLDAIEDARQALKKKYSSMSAQQKFIDTMIAALRR